MLNRRKAMIGYLVYLTGKPIVKRMMKRKARSAVPGMRQTSRMPKVSAVAAGLGALVGGLMFWRRRRAKHTDFFES